MKVAVTGRPGIGKTTLVKKVVSLLKGEAKGFWTEEVRRAGMRWGFKVVRCDGREGRRASVEGDSPFRVGRYRVFVKEFEELVVPFLKELLREKPRLIVVDEVGKMELLSSQFRELCRRFLVEEGNFLVTVPLRSSNPLVLDFKRQFKLIHLTLTNRNRLPYEIVKELEGRGGGEEEKL